MNKALIESRKALLITFCHVFYFEKPPEYDIENFIKSYEKQKLSESKKRLKEAKKTLISEINSDTFQQIKTEMKAKKISISELARRMNRTQQQLSRVLRLENATLRTVENIKKALNYGNTNF